MKESKSIIGILIAIIVALLVFLGWNNSQNKTKLKDKEQEIAEYQTQLESQKAELEALQVSSNEAAASQESAAQEEAASSETELLPAEEEMSEDTLAETYSASDVAELTAAHEEELAAAHEQMEQQSEELAASQELVSSQADELVAAQELADSQADELVAAQELANSQSEELKASQELNASQESELAATQEQMEQQESEYTERILLLRDKLKQISGVRKKIISELEDIFADTNLNVIIDEETGMISLDTSVLFDFGSSDLTEEGETILAEFFPQYFSVLFSDEVKDYVSEILIEGHTDTTGEYLTNLFLSQKRAYSVVEYCLDDTGLIDDPELLEEIRSTITANGRAYFDPVYDENGEVDDDASRRVEIKFRLISDDLLQEMTYSN